MNFRFKGKGHPLSINKKISIITKLALEITLQCQFCDIMGDT